MDRDSAYSLFTILFREINLRLEEAARIAKATELCVTTGAVAEAVHVSMDIEQHVYEVRRLQDAASSLQRITTSDSS